MSDHAHLLDLIERSLGTDPVCPACGAPTTIDEQDGSLWIVCSLTIAPDGFAQRLSAAVLPHRRRLMLDRTELLAA